MRLHLIQLIFGSAACLVLSISCGGGGSNPPPGPVISSFVASPSIITVGGSASLTGVFANGTANVNPGSLPTSSGVAITVAPAATTLYTLTVAGNSSSTATAVVGVNVVPAPLHPIISAPVAVNQGAANLTASVPSQAGCNFDWTIEGGVVTAGAGTEQITFTAGMGNTVQLTCVATNAAGTASAHGSFTCASVSLPLTPVITAPPYVLAGAASLTASVPAQPGCLYSWTIAGGTITEGAANNTVTFTSGKAGTVDLRVVAINAAQTVSDPGTFSAHIVSPPVITSFRTSQLTVRPGQSATLSWVVNGATNLSIDPGVGPVMGTSTVVTPTQTTTYTLTATYEIGGNSFRTTAGQTVALTPSGLSVYALESSYSRNRTGYWVNWTWVPLSRPNSGQPSGNCIEVTGEEIFVGGNDGNAPGYWRNGAWVQLPGGTDGKGTVTALVLVGGEVFAGGYIRSGLKWLPGYWRNGTWTLQPLPNGNLSGAVKDIAVTGSDIHGIGYFDTVHKTSPCYWLNGVWSDPSNALGVPAGDRELNGIALSGADAYLGLNVYNNMRNIPGYLLNGVWNGLPVPSDFETGTVKSLSLFGGSVLLGGSISSSVTVTYPGYWLHGAWNALPIPAGSEGGLVFAAEGNGNDIYAAGYVVRQGQSVRIPGYWFNGTWFELPLPEGSTDGAVTVLIVR